MKPLLILCQLPNFWWAVSLGFRICTEKLPKILELVDRYVHARSLRVASLTTLCQGWVSVLGWQIGLASLTFIVGTVIQGLIVLNNPHTYIFERWHGTLLVWAIIAFCIIFNSFLAVKLPMVEGTVLIIHVVGFFAVLIPLWTLAPRLSKEEVFTQVTNLGGWPTGGLSFMVGLLTPVYTLLGADSAVHMAEEIKDASVTLPRAIMTSAAVNGSLGWIMTITFCFCLGNLYEVIASKTKYPFIQVFYDATQNKAAASVLTAIIIVNVCTMSVATIWDKR